MTDFSKNKAALLNLPKPKAVIFDWDNTLVDTWPLIQGALDVALVAMGHEPWGLEKVRNTVYKSLRESFPPIFGDDWEKAGEIYKKSYRANHLNKIQFLPGSLNLINKLEELGILQFVVSNKVGITLRKEVKALGVENKFFSMVGSLDASADKPSIAPVELALMGSVIDLKKDVVWFVGDTIADVSCAYNCGCYPLVFSDLPNQVAKNILDEDLTTTKNPQGILPVYFDHQEIINLLGSL